MGCRWGGGRGCVFAGETGAGPVAGVLGHIMGCRREGAGPSRVFFPFKRRCRGRSHFPFSGGSGERGAGVRSRGPEPGEEPGGNEGGQGHHLPPPWASGPADASLRRTPRRLWPQLLRGRAVPLPGRPQDGSGPSSPAPQPPRRCPQPRPAPAPGEQRPLAARPPDFPGPAPRPRPGDDAPRPRPAPRSPAPGGGGGAGPRSPPGLLCAAGGRAGAGPALQCQPGAGWGCWPGHRADSRSAGPGAPLEAWLPCLPRYLLPAQGRNN